MIPPAWQDVWISPDPTGHIQAVGTDAAGRRQYRYHDEWRRARDVEQVRPGADLGAEARRRPRRRSSGGSASRAWAGDRVLAAAVRMLDVGVVPGRRRGVRAGDDDEDGTFGLATLRREHVGLKRGAVLFAYPAKGDIPRSARAARPAAAHASSAPCCAARAAGGAARLQDQARLVRREDRGPQRCGQGARGRGVHLQGPAYLERDGAGRRRARRGRRREGRARAASAAASGSSPAR